MRDVDIRQALRLAVETEHLADPSTRVVEELGLRQGRVRVDLAVVNGSIHGYEIKSLADTLRRLPMQVQVYGQVLDFVTIVLAERHREDAEKMIPAWWGIVVAEDDRAGLALRRVRDEQRNPAVDKRALAELLWHEHTLEMLRARDALRGVASKPRAYAWDRLCEVCSLTEIAEAVRARLKGTEAQPPAP